MIFRAAKVPPNSPKMDKPERRENDMTEWFTSPANTAIACLLVIVLAVFAIRGVCRREAKPKQLQPEDIRKLKERRRNR